MIDTQSVDDDIERAARWRFRREQSRLARHGDRVGVRDVQAHRAEQHILRRPVEVNVVRLNPYAIVIGDRDRACTQIAEPRARDVIELDAPKPPDAHAIDHVIDHQVRRRTDPKRRARGEEQAAAREGPPAFAPAWFGRCFAQNAWPRLM